MTKVERQQQDSLESVYTTSSLLTQAVNDYDHCKI